MNEESSSATSAPSAPSLTPTHNHAQAGPARRNKSQRLLPIISILALIGIIVIIFFMVLRGHKDVDIYNSASIFIPENAQGDSGYALFRKSGEKLTGFDYTNAGPFVNGYADVMNKDGKYGIINEDGKMTVDFGKYEYIMPLSGIYEAISGDSKKLILGNGNEIASDYVKYDYGIDSPFALVEYEEHHYRLFDVNGNKLLEFESDAEPAIRYSDATSGYTLVSYKDHIAIYDNRDPHLIYDRTVDTDYNISNVSEDRKTIIFRNSEENYAVYKSGSFYEYGDKCEAINFYSYVEDHEYLACRNDDGAKLIYLNQITDIEASAGDYSIFDDHHYVKYTAADKKLEIFVDGNVKTTVESPTRPILVSGGYLVRDSQNSKSTLYDLEGKAAISLNVQNAIIDGIDDNHNAIVSDPSQESVQKYYLIKQSGEKISDNYSRIENKKQFYYAYNYQENTAALLNNQGSKIASGSYSSFTYYDKTNVMLAQKDTNSYDLIDINNGSVKQELNGYVIGADEGYLKVEGTEKVSYYTVDGKLIHEYSKQQ